VTIHRVCRGGGDDQHTGWREGALTECSGNHFEGEARDKKRREHGRETSQDYSREPAHSRARRPRTDSDTDTSSIGYRPRRNRQAAFASSALELGSAFVTCRRTSANGYPRPARTCRIGKPAAAHISSTS
jgi:hypothetical protein